MPFRTGVPMLLPSRMLFLWRICEAWWSALVGVLLCNALPYILSYMLENEINCLEGMWECECVYVEKPEQISSGCIFPPLYCVGCALSILLPLLLRQPVSNACIWLRLEACRRIETPGRKKMNVYAFKRSDMKHMGQKVHVAQHI